MTQRSKRHGDDLTRRFAKESKSCKTGSLVSGHLCGDCDEDVSTGLCDGLKCVLSRSVASITLCNGDTTLFSFSGIAIDREGCLTRFLTSASLARIYNDLMNKDYGDLKIEVRHEGNEVYNGFLDESYLDHNFAVINVFAYLDVHDVVRCVLDLVPHGEELLTVGRGSSGQIMARIINFSVELRASEEEDLHDKVWEGGPLFSFDGKFVGMNHSLTTRSVMFLPWGTISKRLMHFGISSPKKSSLAQSKISKVNRPIGEKRISHAEVHRALVNQEKLDVDSKGYPKLPAAMLGAGMVLVNTFEETFGDMFGKGVWSKLSDQAFKIDHTVVALASFIGEKRFFACTGFFIEWNGSMIVLTSASLVRNSGDGNEVVAGLRIEVALRENRCQGTLKHYNLHYNIALVSVEDCSDACPANTVVYWKGFEVAAVGRCFESGALMAKTGEIVSWSGALDCHFLVTPHVKSPR
ncbi:hypothetical protein PVAP13_7NG184702 [Panicum virgatum]|nr:hypothetical protein PVAP13_7NG184702 [Panicum virgatum]